MQASGCAGVDRQTVMFGHAAQEDGATGSIRDLQSHDLFVEGRGFLDVGDGYRYV